MMCHYQSQVLYNFQESTTFCSSLNLCLYVNRINTNINYFLLQKSLQWYKFDKIQTQHNICYRNIINIIPRNIFGVCYWLSFCKIIVVIFSFKVSEICLCFCFSFLLARKFCFGVLLCLLSYFGQNKFNVESEKWAGHWEWYITRTKFYNWPNTCI